MEILVKSEDHTHPDPEKDRKGAYKKGDVVVVMPDGHVWGTKEGPPKFVRVLCPELNAGDYQDRAQAWVQGISLSVLSSDLSIDEHRVEVTAQNVSSSGEAAVTRDQAETYIDGWGGTVVSTDTNSVMFDITIESALTSPSFWGVQQSVVDSLTFTNTYDQQAGTHTLEIDYSATGFGAETVNERVEVRGGVVLVNDGSVCTAEFTRSDVRDEFMRELRERIGGTWRRRRYYFDTAQVDTVLADHGGEIEVSATTLGNNVYDRLNE